MKAPLHRISARLHGENWLIRRDTYQSLCRQFHDAAGERFQINLEAWNQPIGKPATAADCCDDDALEGVEISNGIALLRVHGILGKNLDIFDTLCGGFDIATLQQQGLTLQSRSDVHTVITYWNSPGGAAAGIADCARVFVELAQTKRLISYVDECCSGAYWIASASPEIYGGQSCVAGSISAVCSFEDVSAMYAELGIKVEVFRDGDLKGAGIDGTSLSDVQRSDIQGRIEHIGGMFKTFVTGQRPAIEADSMRGQWFYGDQALERGLLDGLAPTLQHVIAMAAA